MTRYLVVRFEVDDNTTPNEVLYELGEQLVTGFMPDPPVLTLDKIDVEYEQ